LDALRRGIQRHSTKRGNFDASNKVHRGGGRYECPGCGILRKYIASRAVARDLGDEYGESRAYQLSAGDLNGPIRKFGHFD
jgi:hypothetical protein